MEITRTIVVSAFGGVVLFIAAQVFLRSDVVSENTLRSSIHPLPPHPLTRRNGSNFERNLS
jgi:hypothetical protein